MAPAEAAALLSRWHDAVGRSLRWSSSDS
jgi:hypothetical protein